MKKNLLCFLIGLLTILLLSGCDMIGLKSTNMAIIYIATAILSLLVLIAYCYMMPKKDMWFLLLFGSILVVNIGYLSLAISKTLEEALLANRISYLGSVFLPMAMMMIILNVIQIKVPKCLPCFLFIIGIAVFLSYFVYSMFQTLPLEIFGIDYNNMSLISKIIYLLLYSFAI